MSLPNFFESNGLSTAELHSRISDRVRLERRRLKLSQRKFAEQCGIPLRTYKRFEQGQCDSLEAFLRIVSAFERTVAIELLFPPAQVPAIETRSTAAALRRLLSRAQQRPNP